ncbi:hypothetical protein Ga0451573_000045 [Peptococcaceae bacterium DYL19]|nr:hypothetical protein [Phosphitispora fastidiosa]
MLSSNVALEKKPYQGIRIKYGLLRLTFLIGILAVIIQK